MRLTDFAWVLDENLHPSLPQHYSQRHDIRSVNSMALKGADDADILKEGLLQNFIVLTQDSDFGKLIFAEQQPFLGVVYVRPGSMRLEQQIFLIDYWIGRITCKKKF